MMNERENIRISKFISLVLRHKPEAIGLRLDENGWVETRELIEKLNTRGFHLTADVLNNIVATSNKNRFAFNEDNTRIRASQGHSIVVNLDLRKVKPPQYLYHGTGERSLLSILATGLEKRERQHVHLSNEIEAALMVGRRRYAESSPG